MKAKKIAGRSNAQPKGNQVNNKILSPDQECKPITEKLLDQLGELHFQLGYQQHSMERFSPVVKCGAISKSTNQPKIIAVRGHYRSRPRRKKPSNDKRRRHTIAVLCDFSHYSVDVVS